MPQVCWRARIDTNEFLRQAKEVHGDTYIYPPYLLYTNQTTKVPIVCRKHGKFWQLPVVHVRNKGGCSKCHHTKLSTIFAKTEAQFWDDLISVHGPEEFSYPKFHEFEYINSNNKVWLHHNSCGEDFDRLPGDLLSKDGKKGCSHCGKISSGLNRRLGLDEVIRRSKERYGEGKLDYSELPKDVITSDTIILTCKDCGFRDDKVILSSHMYKYKHGCAKCADKATGDSQRMTQEQFDDEIVPLHPMLDFSEFVCNGATVKGSVKCLANSKHIPFKATPDSLRSGHGCPSCGKMISHLCTKWLDGLGIPRVFGETREVSLGLGKIKSDGFDPKTNTVYEYNGCAFHGCPCKKRMPGKWGLLEKQEILWNRWKMKEQRILDAGYNLVVMWEHDWAKRNAA